MPKQHLHIPRFDGMYGGADARDLPLTTGAFSLNVDPLGVEGKLSPVKAPGLALAGAGGRAYAVRGDGTEAIFAHGSGSSSVIKRLTGIGSTLAVSTIHTPGAGETDGSICTASDGQAVHVGMGAGEDYLPRWIGEITHGQIWDGSAYVNEPPSGTTAEIGVLYRPFDVVGGFLVSIAYMDGIPTATGASGPEEAVFPVGERIRYYISFGYDDGLQEGPLRFASSYPVVPDVMLYGAKELKANLYVHAGFINPRTRYVNIYRSREVIGSGLESDPLLIRQVDLSSQGLTWNEIDPVYYIEITDTGETGGPSYEERTGIPATLDTMRIHYGLSCVSDGFHFVSRCWHPEIADAAQYLFRSKAYRFDMFDWQRDYLRLPFTPVALVPYAGKVFAFGEGRYLAINPRDLTVIDDYEGAGTFSPESVCVTEKGMFFVSRHNIYYHDGARPIPIGTPVLRNEYVPKGSSGEADMDVSWLALTHESGPVCLYDSQRDAFVVIFSTYDPDSSAPAVWGLMWSAGKERYDYFQTSSAASIDGRFIAVDGTPYVSLDGDLYQLFSGSSLPWSFVTKRITNEDALKIKFYHARVVGSVSALAYSEDEGPWQDAATAADGDSVVKAVVSSSPWHAVRSLQIRLSGTEEVEALGITFRPMGAR